MPKIYNYTFHAGSTCASPDANITITDDMQVENEETFQIALIDAALPFGVQAGPSTTIIINDNDSEFYVAYMYMMIVLLAKILSFIIRK